MSSGKHWRNFILQLSKLCAIGRGHDHLTKTKTIGWDWCVWFPITGSIYISISTAMTQYLTISLSIFYMDWHQISVHVTIHTGNLAMVMSSNLYPELPHVNRQLLPQFDPKPFQPQGSQNLDESSGLMLLHVDQAMFLQDCTYFRLRDSPFTVKSQSCLETKMKGAWNLSKNPPSIPEFQ